MPGKSESRAAEVVTNSVGDDPKAQEAVELAGVGMYDFNQMFDGSTKHADNAMDFSDEDELIDEDNASETKSEKKEEQEESEDDLMAELEQEGMQGVSEDADIVPGGLFGNAFPQGNTGLDDLMLEGATGLEEDKIPIAEDSVKEKKKKTKKPKITTKELQEKLLRVYYPTFRRGKPIKMQTLFPIMPMQFPYQQVPPVRGPLLPTKIKFELAPDTRKAFRMATTTNKKKNAAASLPEPRVFDTSTELAEVDKSANKYAAPEPLDSYQQDLLMAAADWDEEAILGGAPANKKRRVVPSVIYDDWAEDDDRLIEGKIDLHTLGLRLDMNDTALMMEDEAKKNRERANREKFGRALAVARAETPLTTEELESRYNLSNDKEYNVLIKNFHTKVRSTIGNLTIEHAPPASRLQSPFYPVKPNSDSLRELYRPKFAVRSNTTMLFSKPKVRKRKRDRGKDASQLFPRTEDLTVGDTAQFFFMEYSEEVPVALGRLGMGSKIINYYRKVTEQDTSRPKLPIGETHVLGLEDRSPFWNFGYVENGNIVPTLYNQMIRAPIFQHDASPTDFLLVRSAGNGSAQRYFLKSIGNLFTVGQTFPAVEVPGPHSRKVSSISKNRLRMIVFRLLNADDHQRLLVKDISKHFPEHTDMQNRQRLKEFMEYRRSGEDQGFWKVKGQEKAPSYDSTRRMISPEDICLLGSMQAAQQRFDDIESFRRERLSSLGATEREKEREKQKEHTEESITLQLAPWNTTRNFIQATQGKAMLQIHGNADPSKNSNQFSFLKISMKGGFLKNVENSEAVTPATPATPSGKKEKPLHSYNVAEQQQLYDEEIAKVWYRQRRILSSGGSSRARTVDDAKLHDDSMMRMANKEIDREVDEPARFLKITRMVKNSYGILERQVDVIRDHKVVELYVRRKQASLLEDPTQLDNDTAVLTNDVEENMKVKKRLEEELKKLEKQHEKKKKKMPGITAANIDSQGRISGKGIGKGKSTSRRCATCGALGHIRTNKSCPLYYTIHNKSNPNYVPGTEKSAHLLTIAQNEPK